MQSLRKTEAGSVYSISAGLDYPGVGPEHALFKDSGRVEYVAATDEEAVQACSSSTRLKRNYQQNEKGSHAIAKGS